MPGLTRLHASLFLTPLVLFERMQSDLGQGDGSCSSSRLYLPKTRDPPAHVQDLVLHVKILPAQPEQFSPAQARRDGNRQERFERLFLCSFNQVFDLLTSERMDLVPCGSGLMS